MDKLEALIARYRGEAHEDEMVAFYPLARLRREPRRGVDRYAAACVPAVRPRRSSSSRLGDRACRQRQRQGKARRVQRAVRPARSLGALAAPGLRAGADAAPRGRSASRLRRHHPRRSRAVHVGRYAARSAICNSIRTIDQMGEFIAGARGHGGPPALRRRCGQRRRSIATRPRPPSCRICAASCRRIAATIAHWDSSEDALAFANSKWAEDLCGLGTSCPDHFLRTRISPMFVPWDPAKDGLPS